MLPLHSELRAPQATSKAARSARFPSGGEQLARPNGTCQLCGRPPQAPPWPARLVSRLFLAAWIVCALDAAASTCCGQAAAPSAQPVDPRPFGLDLPAGIVKSAAGRRVLVEEADEPVVARVHVEIGDHLMVLLPDGRLVARRTAETTATDRPFQPLAAQELGTRLARGPLQGFTVRTSRHFVFVGNASEEFTTVTARMLESMVPGLIGFAELWKLKPVEPELPLPVILFRKESQYQQYRRMPAGVVAYYDILANAVVLCEESPLGGARPELALQQTFATIAHEGVHQILANTGVQQRLSAWPMWLSEGLAEYLAPTSPGKKLRWKGPGQVNDLRMFDLERYLKSRDADAADGQMVEHTVLAARLTATGYASAWALTHYLAKNQRPEFQKLLTAASRLGPLEGDRRIEPPGVSPVNLREFRTIAGDDFAGMERKLIGHLKRLPYTAPFADLPHVAAVVVTGAGPRARRDSNVFHEREQAERWVQDVLAKLPADQRDQAQATIRVFPNRVAAEAFARQGR